MLQTDQNEGAMLCYRRSPCGRMCMINPDALKVLTFKVQAKLDWRCTYIPYKQPAGNTLIKI